MSDSYGAVTAEKELRASHSEYKRLLMLLNSTNGDCDDEEDAHDEHGFEIDYSAKPTSSVYLFAQDGYWDSLPKDFLAFLGTIIEKNGLSHLEFGVAYIDEELSPGSNGGTAFRILADGRIIRPRVVWDE